MPDLKGTKTHENLKAAFAGESQANRRYLYFAKAADIEGYPEVGGLFRDTAEAETGHAHGHLDYLKAAGDPATDKPIGATDKNLVAAVAGSRRIVRQHPDVKDVMVRMSFQTIPLIHPDLYALDVLSYVLTNGQSSRLVQTIRREAKLVTGISSS